MILDYTYNACKPEIKNNINNFNDSLIRDIARVLKINTMNIVNCVKKEKYIQIYKYQFVKAERKNR